MNIAPELIVMLTHNDKTVSDAYEVFLQCADTKVKYWGIKELGLEKNKMIELFSCMKNSGKSTVLEVVAYKESECLDGVRLAIECGCDILMGTLFYDSVNEICRQNRIKYMPFIGEVTGRPSVLNGSPGKMISQANEYIQKGVYGFDLLGYRYTGDKFALNSSFVKSVQSNVCIAGSVCSYDKLDEILKINPWAFTIGSAFFENKFGTSVKEQINNVYSYINSKQPLV